MLNIYDIYRTQCPKGYNNRYDYVRFEPYQNLHFCHCQMIDELQQREENKKEIDNAISYLNEEMNKMLSSIE